MFDDIVRITGAAHGPTSMILAGVHGNERGGIEALRRALPKLRIDRGTVLAGYGNPRAIERGTRSTEANLNRLFRDDAYLTEQERKSYEYERAAFLRRYMEEADALLDLHGTSIPGSNAFAICEASAMELAGSLPVDLIVSGFDILEPGATDYYMNSRGKVGICFECGYIEDSAAIQVGETAIDAFLKARGHVSGKIERRSQARIGMFMKYRAKTDSFALLKPFGNFEFVDEGQLIGIDGEDEVRAPKPSLILFAHNGRKLGDEVFLLGEPIESSERDRK